MPGTLVGSTNQGYDARLVIRGSGLKARYGIREIMLLLNGIPVTDPDSFTRLDFVDTQMIERVEVVRGPNSTLWGINSTGGVVNVITRSPAEGSGGGAGIDLGSWGASSLQAHYAGRAADRWFYSLDFSRRQADNDWRVHNEFDSTQFTFQPHYVFGDDSVLENYISYTEADLQLPGKLVVDDNRGIDQWTPYVEDGDVEETAEPWKDSGRYSKILFLSSRLRTRVGELLVEPLVFVNRWSHFHPVTGKINEADTWVGGIDAPAIWRHGGGTLTFGLTARFDVHDGEAFTYADVISTPSGRILATESDRKGELMEATEQVTTLYGVYAQESLALGQRWLIDLGFRADRITFDISGHEWIEYDYSRGGYAPGPGPIDASRSYTSLSPRVAAMYKVNSDLNLYGNVSTGAQTPTFSELTTNPDLELTEVLSYELGLKGRFSLFSFDAALYHATVHDEVVQVIEGSGYTEYVNAGETEKIGAELSVTAVPAMGLMVGANYAWSHYRFVEFSEPAYGRNIDRAGNQLPFIPEHQLSLFASWAHRSGFLARVTASSWGEYFVDNANSETYEGYSFVTEVAAGSRWQGFEVMLMVENLFDDRHAVEVQKDLYGKLRYSPTAPRSFRVRLSYRF
jgi:iron complex outermembrane receptor protein